MRLLLALLLLLGPARGQELLPPSGPVMPALVGRELEEARPLLAREPLVLQVSGGTAGRIVRQSPQAGAPLNRGQSPTLWVSTGTAPSSSPGPEPRRSEPPAASPGGGWWLACLALPALALFLASRMLRPRDGRVLEMRRKR